MTKEIYGNISCSVRMVGPPQFYIERGERKPYRNRWKTKNPHPKPRFKKGSGKQRRRSAVIMHIV